MSDSPLDGGSGWPTSAYAIVPRQPSPPVAESAPAATADEPEESGKPEKPEPLPARAPSRTGRIVTVVIGVIVLIAAVVGVVLATRKEKAGGGTTATAATTPVLEATTGAPLVVAGDPSGSAPAAGASATGGADASTAPSASGGAEASAAASGAVPSGEASTATPAVTSSILRSDTAQFVILAGQPDEAYDFDTATKQAAGADATAGAVGLKAANGASFAVLASPDTPTLAACSAIPADRWIGQVTLAGVLPGSKVCVKTSEQRYAWFMTRAGEPVAGALLTANLDFVVYKKAGD